MLIKKLIRTTLLAIMALVGITTAAYAQDTILVLQLQKGIVKIKLRPDLAPKNVERVEKLAQAGVYNGVAFHRVISGFMAQTGDVQFGNVLKNYTPGLAGTGGSSLPDLPLEVSHLSFDRGVVAMARTQNPQSANSQFFICFDSAPWLNGQYTIIGQVIEGMSIVDQIKKGDASQNGLVHDPDYIIKAFIMRH